MKNKRLKSLLLGASTAAAASSASYALIAPDAFEELRSTREQELISQKVEEITKRNVTPKPVAIAPEAPKEPKPVNHTVKAGESLAEVFINLGFSANDLHKITHANDTGKQFTNVLPGQSLQFTTNRAGELEQLAYSKNMAETVVAKRKGDGFEVSQVNKKIDTQVATASGSIHDSLFEDGLKAGMTEKLLLKMIEVFSWDVDFAQNLQDGDRFTVVFEKRTIEGKTFETGNILAAEFINKGKVYSAVRFEDKQGNVNYYSPDGNGLRKAFLQMPVDFAHISSHFSLGRKHPILNTIRAHKGVDYAARTGSPVKTTADGKITFLGERNGYGKVIEINHGNQYSTLYAHLSNYKTGKKTGSAVKQGEVIGFVGQTGLATGPHLHYEFRINGVHVNPESAKIPRSLPMDKSLLAKFKAQTQPWVAALQQAKAATVVAQK